MSVAQLPGGLRGLQATKDLAEGELVFTVPASLGVPLGDYLLHSAVNCTPHAPAGPASPSLTCCKNLKVQKTCGWARFPVYACLLCFAVTNRCA